MIFDSVDPPIINRHNAVLQLHRPPLPRGLRLRRPPGVLARRPLDKRALTFRKYNTFQISGGVGGSALAETNAAFPVDMSNPGAVSKSDLAILVAARQTAENAETAFNSAVAASSGAAAQALDVGKTKNKVLKLRTFEMLVQVQQARGSKDKDAQLADIQKKLAANVKLDQANKGKKSQSFSFTADVQPK
ncbi:uncharacterized protein PG986_010194 [Apiospora aurea]|uniref:Uncharacterized protein n=1 Tax=Apiospora aurea TaxID=335848 RepID=A0ABR1Q9T7_9PEZI